MPATGGEGRPGGGPGGGPSGMGGGASGGGGAPDLREKGGLRQGQPQFSDTRLFMQLLVFNNCPNPQDLLEAVKPWNQKTVVYAAVHDPHAAGLLTISQDPVFFPTTFRNLLNNTPFTRNLTIKPEFSFFGRTYSLGYEPDLQDTLIDRPLRTATNPLWPWAVWYPLRRKGSFAQLPDDQQRAILAEHGRLGHAFGSADLGHDIRLACHGLDTHDNDFLIALIGKDLHPLSALVQTMRKTQQTSLYLERLGPFFVGYALR